jgi:hypothetical protein
MRGTGAATATMPTWREEGGGFDGGSDDDGGRTRRAMTEEGTVNQR